MANDTMQRRAVYSVAIMVLAATFSVVTVGCSNQGMTGDMKTTLAHTDQTPKKVTDWGSLAWAVNAKVGNCNTMTLGRVSIKADKANGRHRHGNCDELLYVVSGELDHYADDVGTLRMKAGDVIVIPAGVVHNARCVSKTDADLIVIYSSAAREFEPVADHADKAGE
ncbi:MAG: cupin domain-containing protein [Phycisphaerae bacterium]|jgi:quercetin dioxygenase-like cupin family protein|nr:cupin domain-containing protein [Phycisphaerae bacterium]